MMNFHTLKSQYQKEPVRALFDLMWVIFLAYNILDNTSWVALSPGFTFSHIFRILRFILGGICIVIGIYNLVRRKYTVKSVILYAMLGIVIALSAWRSGNYTYIWYFLVFAAAWQQDARRVVFISACVTGFMMILIVGCSFVGLGVDYIFDSVNRARHGLGFGWTTTAPTLFFFFVLQYLFLRKERMKIYEYLILEGIAVFFYLMTDTNLAFFLTTAVLVFLFVEGRLPNRWRFWSRLKWFWILLPLILCILALSLYIFYQSWDGTWDRLNSLMHNRLLLGQTGLQEYGITPFGQPIEWRGFFIFATDPAGYNYIDCSYLQLLLEHGVCFLVAVIGIYTAGMYKAVKVRQYHLVWILAAVLLFSVMEPRLMNLTFNLFPLMAFLRL